MATQQTLYKTHGGMSYEQRSELVTLLNQQLADTLDLYTQTKQAHWNVKGIHFIALHEFFDTLATAVFPFVDLIAERVTALGGVAMGTTRMGAQNSSLPEYPLNLGSGTEHLRTVVERFGAYAASTRAAIARGEELNDPVTVDMFTEVSAEIEKSLYFLESHLQDKG